VGDLFMSLIHTAELCGANPFDYLTQLQRHADEMKENPSQWMPWNYRDTLSTSTRDKAVPGYDLPASPKTIDCGPGERHRENGPKTGLSESRIRNIFGQARKAAENVSCRGSCHVST